MAVPVIMPKTGMSQETGTVVKWYYKEGEHVEKGEPLLEVMTDKVNMDVESPASGVLRGIRAFPNDVVPVTQVIAYIVEPGEVIGTPEAGAALPPEGIQAVVEQPVEKVGLEEKGTPVAKAEVAPVPVGKVAATPAARKLAQERGLDLTRIAGSGPDRVITKADVLAAAERLAAPVPPVAAGARTVPLVGRRRIIAQRMQQSAQQAPHITLTVEVDMTEATTARRGASYTALLVQVVAQVLRKHPMLNATLQGEQIVLRDEINIGVAVAAEDGLIVPVVKNADKKPLEAIDAEIKDLSQRGRVGKLTLDDVSGGTFTISNLGMFGVTEFHAIINPPEAAILAIGAVVKRPVVVGEQVVIRPMMNITASADHRILDGVAVANFLQDLKAALEKRPTLEVREPRQLVIIGAGSGGFMAALRAAELGAKVTVVEKKWLGGTCLNEGCIPTKSLVESARRLTHLEDMAEFGVKVTGHSFDLAQAMARKSKVVGWLVGGLERQLAEARVRVVMGTARLQDAHHVIVAKSDGSEETLEAGSIIVATGSQPTTIPGFEQAWTSTDALAATAVPRSLLIVGAGAIGVEFACIYAAFGSKVTLVEALDSVLPKEDAEISQGMAWLLQKRGIAVYTSSEVLSAVRGTVPGTDDWRVRVRTPKGEQSIEAEKVLIAVGRKPCSTGLNLESIGVAMERGNILVNDRQQTNVEGIYAIGDVIGKSLLAHGAFAEGEVAAENALGGYARMNYDALPRCVYSLPEVAAVGLSEQEAKAQGGAISVGRVSWAATEKALIEGQTDGMVKVVARDGRLLGLHIMGPSASVLVMEGTLGRAWGARLDDLIQVIHPHPTLSEAVSKAMLKAIGRNI